MIDNTSKFTIVGDEEKCFPTNVLDNSEDSFLAAHEPLYERKENPFLFNNHVSSTCLFRKKTCVEKSNLSTRSMEYGELNSLMSITDDVYFHNSNRYKLP